MPGAAAPSAASACTGSGSPRPSRSRARSIAAAQPLGAERLQQVVDGVHLEGAQRVLIVGGDEDHGDVAADQLEHLEAVELRHLHVEQQQIGLQLGHRLDRLEAVGALGDDLDAGIAARYSRSTAARQLFVVDNRDPQSGTA